MSNSIQQPDKWSMTTPNSLSTETKTSDNSKWASEMTTNQHSDRKSVTRSENLDNSMKKYPVSTWRIQDWSKTCRIRTDISRDRVLTRRTSGLRYMATRRNRSISWIGRSACWKMKRGILKIDSEMRKGKLTEIGMFLKLLPLTIEMTKPSKDLRKES